MHKLVKHLQVASLPEMHVTHNLNLDKGEEDQRSEEEQLDENIRREK